MLDDCCRSFKAVNNQPISAKIKFELPPEWKVISSEKRLGENSFFVSILEKRFFWSKKLARKEKFQLNKTSLNFAASASGFFRRRSIKWLWIFWRIPKIIRRSSDPESADFSGHFSKTDAVRTLGSGNARANLTVLSSDYAV